MRIKEVSMRVVGRTGGEKGKKEGGERVEKGESNKE